MAGHVAALFTKPAKSRPMLAHHRLEFRARLGIPCDASADPASPRQVLLVSERNAAALCAAPGAMRENVTVRGIDIDTVPSGHALRLGTAILRVTFPCDPCGQLRRYTGIEPEAAATIRGVLAVVASSGTSRIGDAVEDLGPAFLPLPTTAGGRLRWHLGHLPAGSYVTYGDLAKAAGLPSSAVRAVPGMLARHLGGLASGFVVTEAASEELGHIDRHDMSAILYRPTADSVGDISPPTGETMPPLVGLRSSPVRIL